MLMWLAIIAVPLLLGAIGIYCMTQGKLNSDTSTIFYAGAARLGAGLIAALVGWIYIARSTGSANCCAAHTDEL